MPVPTDAPLPGSGEIGRSLRNEPRPRDNPPPARFPAGSGLLLLAIIGVLYLGRDLFVPITLAVVIALVLRPIVRVLCRLRIPESVGATILVLALLGAGIFGGMALYAPAMDWLKLAPATLRDAADDLRQFQQNVEDFDRAANEVERLTRSKARDVPAVQVQNEGWQTILLRNTASTLAQAFVTLALVLFLLATRARLLRKAMELLVAPTRRTTQASVISETEHEVSRYLFTVSAINACLGVAVGVTMWAWGMPNPVLWGVLAAVFNYVPYLGAVAGVAITFLVAAVSFDDLRWFAVPLSNLLLTSVEGTLITPAILGRRFAVDPVVVILWLIFWGGLWGVGGALLAMPLLVILRIVSERVPAMGNVARLLSSDEPARAPRPLSTA